MAGLVYVVPEPLMPCNSDDIIYIWCDNDCSSHNSVSV